MSRSDRRTGVIINYICLAAIVMVVDMRDVLGWGTLPTVITLCAATALGLVTFTRVFWRTRLWKITHAGFAMLDERQVQVVYDSLRISYWMFTIVCLVILYVNSVAERGHIPVLVAGSVLYLAHTLPGAVVAWTEEEVPRVE
jgi:hypothetical protein